MRKLFRLLYTFFFTLSGLVLTALLLMLIVLGTETGSRWLLQTVFSTTDMVSAKQIEGNLLTHIHIKQLQYQQTPDFKLTVEELQLSWQAIELFTGQMHISLLQVQDVTISGQPEASESEDSKGEIPVIPLTIKLDAFRFNNVIMVEDESRTEVKALSGKVELENNTLTLSALQLIMPDAQVKGRSQIKLQTDWPLNADLDWVYFLKETPINGKLHMDGDLNRLVINHQLQGAVKANQSGFISFNTPQPVFDISGQWDGLSWPISGQAEISSRQGDFAIKGTAEDYQLQLKAQLHAADYPDFSVELAAQGNTRSLDIEQLLIQPERGQLMMTGQFAWSPLLAFDLALMAKQIDPAMLGTKIQAELNAKIQTKGTVENDQVKASVTIEQLTGQLFKQAIDASGNLQVNNRKITIADFLVVAGKNTLLLKGYVNEQDADLSLNINAPDLQTAWPTLGGSLNGHIAASGQLSQALIQGKLHGQKLVYDENKINTLNLDVDYKHASLLPSAVKLTVQDVQAGKNEIKQIVLQGQGNQEKHQILLEFQSSLANLGLNTQGEWNGQRWLTTIKQLDVQHPQLKQWSLQQESQMMLTPVGGSMAIDLSQICLQQIDANLCLSMKGNLDKRLDGRMQLNNWSLVNAQPWLAEELTLQGFLSTQGVFSLLSGDLNAELSAELKDAKALLKDHERSLEHIMPLTRSTLSMSYQGGNLSSHIHLGLTDEDHITADIKADQVDKKGPYALSGNLVSEISELTFIDGLLPNLSDLKGGFSTNLLLAGNTEEPIITGVALLQNGQCKVRQLGGMFTNISFKANSVINNPWRLQLSASIDSGPGQLSANGYWDILEKDSFPLQLSLTGKQFQIAQLPEAEVIVSPDLKIEQRGRDSKIRGVVKVDKARVEIKTLPESAIAPSEDEMIVDRKQSVTVKQAPATMDVNVKIEFDDDINFAGFGLQTKLKGLLEYTLKESRQTMQGRAEMYDAKYASYGQDLTIRKGEFLFNGPTDNPWINLEAIRKAKSSDVTAVLSVSGPVKSPQTRIYSEPALPESEALAYLVTGNSLKAMGKSDSNAFASAALSYGAGQLGWIKDQLGIDEFEIEQGETIQDSAARLGQYLNPDLYVGVTMGLFSNTYAADLRYRLNKYFSVHTRAGETQRLGLKYQFETD